MLDTARQVQIPLLAVMLLGGCAAKAWRVLRSRSISAGLGPTALFPIRLRRPIMIAIFAVEFGAGVGLVATAGRFGAGLPATVSRMTAVVFFLVAIAALYEVRQRRPAAGCGCFGELSDTPVGPRTITRACLLCLSATATIGLRPLCMPSSTREAGFWLAVGTFELALVAFLSPEFGAILVRLGHSEPCELSRVPVEQTLADLRASAQWRRHAAQVSAPAPADVWREGCWRFVVYPGLAQGRRVDIVFAVYLAARPTVRAAVVDADDAAL
jgi:hypothetical protein